MLHKCFFVAILFFLSPFCNSASGSTLLHGSIIGKVYDAANEEAHPGVNVVVVGSWMGAATDEQGRFAITKVPPGTYQVKVSAIGYLPVIKPAVAVASGQQTYLEIALVRQSVRMDEVEVVASAFAKNPETPVSAIHLSHREIRWLAGGLQDPLRAVVLMPGVAQTKIDRNDLLVRGGGPSENLVVVDNIELSYFNHYGTQGATGGSLSFINLELVDRASFSTGGFGVRYGDKLSSVYDISLTEGNSEVFVGKATLSSTQLGVIVEGPVADQGSFIFSARRSYLDMVFRAYGFGFVPEFWDHLAKVAMRVGKHDKLKLLAVHSDDTFKFLNDSDEQRYNNSRLLFTDQTHNIGAISWSHFFEKGYLLLTCKVSESKFHDQQNDIFLNPIFTSESREQESLLQGDVVVSLTESSEISAGLKISQIHFRSTLNFSRPTSMYGERVAAVRAMFDTLALRSAAYFQFTQTFGPARLTFGIRATRFGVPGDRIYVAPRSSAHFTVANGISLFASAGYYYQAPSYIWLTATPFNRSLSAIGGRQLVVGGEHILGRDIRLSVEAYDKHYFDYPISVNRPYLAMSNTGVGLAASLDGAAAYGIDLLISSGRGRSRGVEVLLQKKAIDSLLYGLLSATYAKSDFISLDGRIRPSSYDQRWIINIALGCLVSGVWNVGGTWRYFTGRPYTPFGDTPLQDRYNSARIQANHSLDVSVSRSWTFDRWVLKTFLNIQNIYNRKPYDAPIFSERRKREEQPPSMGIVPGIGISLETK